MKRRKQLCAAGVRILGIALLLSWQAPLQAQTTRTNTDSGFPVVVATEVLGWRTNPPVIYQVARMTHSNSLLAHIPEFRARNRITDYSVTNLHFVAFFPESLNYLVWTNFLARTNGRDINIWAERTFPKSPTNVMTARWNTNSLMWGMKGMTGLAPHWEADLGSGQSPITALTRRHGYTRGHGMGLEGFTRNRSGMKVWFLSTDNRVVEVKITQSVVRCSNGADYTIVLFDRDLPKSIEPLRVTALSELQKYYLLSRPADFARPIFFTEQRGQFSTTIPPLDTGIVKGGDSGCPNLFPLPGELIFYGGRTTSGPTPEMQADMDALCRMVKLDPRKYQMQWLDLSKFPAY